MTLSSNHQEKYSFYYIMNQTFKKYWTRGVFVFLAYLLINCICQDLYAAGEPCFNYEIHEHEAPNIIIGANDALLNYGYQTIANRNNAIPVLGMGGFTIGLSFMDTAALLPLWHHRLLPLGAPLTLQEACLMAIERESIGIEIKFQDFPNIIHVALGNPPTPYTHTALKGGGYLAPMARAVYRLRHFPLPNFLIQGANIHPNTLIIHIHSVRRVSKNLKELSFNARINPTLQNAPLYLSIKGIINLQYAPLGTPPNSATIVSHDHLQRQ